VNSGLAWFLAPIIRETLKRELAELRQLQLAAEYDERHCFWDRKRIDQRHDERITKPSE
jgi:hypothetical protein